MITMRRSDDRLHMSSPAQETWRAFDSENPADSMRRGFRALGSLDETVLHPGMGLESSDDLCAAEDILYVVEGELIYQNSNGGLDRQGVGEFQRNSSDGAPCAVNGSLIDDARLLLISLTPAVGRIQPSFEKKRFLMSERMGVLRLIASRRENAASLLLGQDVRVYSALVNPGTHLVHELGRERGAWLHVVKGRLRLMDHSLCEGDGAALTGEPALSMTGQELSEILLIDLP